MYINDDEIEHNVRTDKRKKKGEKYKPRISDVIFIFSSKSLTEKERERECSLLPLRFHQREILPCGNIFQEFFVCVRLSRYPCLLRQYIETLKRENQHIISIRRCRDDNNNNTHYARG